MRAMNGMNQAHAVLLPGGTAAPACTTQMRGNPHHTKLFCCYTAKGQVVRPMEIHARQTQRRVQGQDDMHVPPVLQAEPHKTGGTLNFLCRHSQSYCVRAKSQPPHSPTLTYPTIDCSSTAPAVDTEHFVAVMAVAYKRDQAFRWMGRVSP